MAGNLKPANAGAEMTSYVVNKAILDAVYDYTATNPLGFFDGKSDGTYQLSYFYSPNDYLDITLNEACNIWALPHNGGGDSLMHNAPLVLLVWNGNSFVASDITENPRSTTAGEWSKIFANLPAGRYKFYSPGVSGTTSNRTYRMEGEWYLEKAIAIPNVPFNLAAVAGNSQVVLNWSAATGAAGYNVKRATIAGGPYTVIASNVQSTTYTDTTVVNGTTYYYVVTALNAAGESTNSNEASAMPVAPVTSKSVLRVTLNDSSEREYTLSNVEVEAFIAWINQASRTPSYAFSVVFGTQDSKEYLLFGKIISFEVIPVK